uniref:Uncharacterized protein n=1 Tax=Oryza meridionalis TaxID=40149 RepID=A0A0E0DAA4_9ORYZ
IERKKKLEKRATSIPAAARPVTCRRRPPRTPPSRRPSPVPSCRRRRSTGAHRRISASRCERPAPRPPDQIERKKKLEKRATSIPAAARPVTCRRRPPRTPPSRRPSPVPSCRRRRSTGAHRRISASRCERPAPRPPGDLVGVTRRRREPCAPPVAP